MKRVSRIAILAWWLCALGGAAPFSHRVHLKLRPDCTSCHTTVTHSTGVEDNNLPSPAVCKPCHESVSIPPPPPTRLVHFSHEKHLQLGNIGPIIAKAIDTNRYLSPAGDLRANLSGTNACLACHRGIDTSDAVSRANMPQMADCLVCHNKIELPFSCEQCHGPGARLRPADHPPEFLESHSRPDAKFDKTTCALCHGRQFRCLGCH
ncbi:MAG: cytochrome c3 family protein [Acidobacteriia bacterium]|nr:cytochrome c3 family protein [Terriglobia bacterium]